MANLIWWRISDESGRWRHILANYFSIGDFAIYDRLVDSDYNTAQSAGENAGDVAIAKSHILCNVK